MTDEVQQRTGRGAPTAEEESPDRNPADGPAGGSPGMGS
jgi:hypothetical protein